MCKTNRGKINKFWTGDGRTNSISKGSELSTKKTKKKIEKIFDW